MKVVFMGSDRWSVPALIRLSSELDVSLVVTRAPRPAGRGSIPKRTEVATAASSLGVQLREVERIGDDDGLEVLTDVSPDAIAVVAYGEILPPSVLSLAPCVNLHFSLLPRWRGAAPVQHALLAGDERTGVTTMLMDEGLDTGPILMSKTVPIEASDDAGSLGSKLADEGAEELLRTLSALQDLTPRAQSGEVTFAPKLTSADRKIDWTDPAADVARRVRALSPDPGANAVFRERILKIFECDVEPTIEAARPGEVIQVGRDRFTVACGEGIVEILSLGSEGRSRLSAAEWLRGARLRAGETLE